VSDPLLDAVLEAPEEMAPRRAFADAIRAHDPERAELIDLQLALREAARRGEEPANAAVGRALALTRFRGRDWAGALASLAKEFWYWGGFVEQVRLPPAVLLASGEELCRLAPIRHLMISNFHGAAEAVARSPVLERLVSLDLGSVDVTDEDLSLLFAHARFSRLRHLSLIKTQVTVAGLRAVAAAPVPALEYVAADLTEAALVVRQEDWGGPIGTDWTRNRSNLLREVGTRPWLERLEPMPFEAL
jgi:uncharacterized protein (TIGR02996 family)